MENNASETWDFWKKKKIEKGYANRTKFEKDDKRYSFGIKLCERMNEHGYTAEKLKSILDDMLPKAPSLQTIRDWMQHKAFPEEAKTMAALCYIFQPYSFEYFSGIIDEEPNRNIQFIKERTGLPSEKTIDHLKELFDKHPESMKALLESDVIDTIVTNIEEAQSQEDMVLYEEQSTNTDIRHFIDLCNPYFTRDEQLNNEAKSVSETIQKGIKRLSTEELNNTFSSVRAFNIRSNKMRVQERLDTYFEDALPKLKALHYEELLDTYNQFIKPIESIEDIQEDYFVPVLMPLREELEYRFEEYRIDYAKGKKAKEAIAKEIEENRKKKALFKKASELSNSETAKKWIERKGISRKK